MLQTRLFSTVLYGCETSTYYKKIRNKLLAFEMYCYRRILRITWTVRKTNHEICDKLRIEKDLLQRAIQTKLQLFGHIHRMEDNRMLKTLMFGIVDGMNKRGTPFREWMDDIVSWCKTELQELNSLAQDRKRWKLTTRQAMDTNGRWSYGS